MKVNYSVFKYRNDHRNVLSAQVDLNEQPFLTTPIINLL